MARPPWVPTGRSNILLLLLLLLLIAVLLYWAWSAYSAPDPAASGIPVAVPGGAPG